MQEIPRCDTTHLLLPYLLAAQAQKHVTVNEALRLLDGIVQLAVLDRHRTAPPADPADGDRHIVAPGATGPLGRLGPQRRLLGRRGLDAAAAAAGLAGLGRRRGGLPRLGRDRLGRGRPAGLLLRRGLRARPCRRPDPARGLRSGGDRAGRDAQLRAAGRLDRTRRALRRRRPSTATRPSRARSTASGPVATIGTAPGTATYGLGVGATAAGATKTVNLGTGGAGGSQTVVNIGPDAPGADGVTVISTPVVTFANAVTEVGMPQANLTAQLLGLGGATADAFNRLSVNTPAVLLNDAGGGHRGDGEQVRAGAGRRPRLQDRLLGPRALRPARRRRLPGQGQPGRRDLPRRAPGRPQLGRGGAAEAARAARARAPRPRRPAAGRLAVYARSRAGAPWLDVDAALGPGLSRCRRISG